MRSFVPLPSADAIPSLTPEEQGVLAVRIVHDLQPLLAFGFCLVLAFLVIELANYLSSRPVSGRPNFGEECKLHGRRLSDCPPESHAQGDAAGLRDRRDPAEAQAPTGEGSGDAGAAEEPGGGEG
jgi:hypothetical protein